MGTRSERRRAGKRPLSVCGALVLLALMAACGSGARTAEQHRLGGPPATTANGERPGTMGQGGAPRMMGRGSGAPPPTVTIAPTATPGGNAPVSFGRDVLPLLTSQCGSCHGGQGGLWVTSYEQVMAGGQSGPVVVPGKPDQSSLYVRITGQKQPRMPLNAPPLTNDQIDAIRGWIAEGAPKN